MTLQLVPSICVLDEEGCVRNVKSALQRGLPLLTRSPRRRGKLAIVGSGPSALKYTKTLKKWPGEIWAINGAYEWLKTIGVTAHAFVGMDPVPGLVEYVDNPSEQTSFFISSVCDPGVFDRLQGFDVWMWHTKRGNMPYPEGAQTVAGGTTCLTRAPFLANVLGWRDVTLFGADSSYKRDPYCYGKNKFKEDSDRETIRYRVNGRVFKSELALAKQAAQLSAMYHDVFPKGTLKIMGDGLTKALIDAPEMDVNAFQ